MGLNENLELFLNEIWYHNYDWQPCGDLKIKILLLGQQLGYTKHL